ncbi:unnamed protein product [Pocillopora meandrina]|uniref:Uncharacterized protein n=1 Tax=Pocillopora meandrina TaxID=46732 RepID=A0AAU9WJ71_9CNID|nr:unnamed protein product [Pocillopora meandrina]
MSAAERRAQRRKKVLENSESRLQRILGSRSSHPDNSESNLVVDGNISNSSSVGNADNSCKNILSVDTKESDYTTGENKKLPVEKNQGDQISDMYPAEGNNCGSQDSEANENSFLDNEVKCLPKVTSAQSRSHNTFPSTAAVNETHSDESSGFSTAIWTRTVFVVILAFSLVIRWTYVNLEVLFSINGENSRNDVSNEAVLVKSEVQLLNSRATKYMTLYSVHGHHHACNLHDMAIPSFTVTVCLCTKLPTDIQLSLYFLAHCCIATLWNSNRIYPHNQLSFYCSSGCLKGLWSFLFLCGCCSLLGGIQHKCGTSEVCNGDLNKKLPSDLCYLKSFTSTNFISSVEKFLASCLVLFCCELLGSPPPEVQIGCVASENNISE